jgi:hypothetical protein
LWPLTGRLFITLAANTHHPHPFTTTPQDIIHRTGPEVLEQDLPPRTEYVIGLRPSPVQQALYATYLEQLQELNYPKKLFRDFEVRAGKGREGWRGGHGNKLL